jgi:hypothetical protein
MIHPFNIEEGGVQYTLGTFDGQNVLYDFPKIPRTFTILVF